MVRDAISLINGLQSHMFSVDVMRGITSIQSSDDALSDKVGGPEMKISKPKMKELPTNLWVPPYQDKMFWCFYRLLVGDHKYEEARKHSFRVEREMKIAAVETLRCDPVLAKACHFKMNDIETELVGSKRITHMGLGALCVANKISILYVRDRTYMTIHGEGSYTWQGLIITKDGVTGLRRTVDGDMTPTSSEINDIESKLYWIGNPSKPIKAISAYSLSDLGKIAERLGVSLTDKNGKRKLKKLLYEDITTYL